MKKRYIIILDVCITFCITVLLYTVAWACGVYMPWAQVPDGVYTRSGLESNLNNEHVQTLNFKLPEGDTLVQTRDFATLNTTVTELGFWDNLRGISPTIKYKWDVDDVKLDKMLNAMRTSSLDATINITDSGKIQISEARQGNDFSVSEVHPIVVKALIEGAETLDLNSYCKSPNVVVKDLQSYIDRYDWVNDWKIVYTDGTVIDSSNLKDCWTTNYTLNAATIDISDVIESLKESYYTKEKSLDFTTSKGNKIKVPYGTYGCEVNEKLEMDFILKAIEERSTYVDRVPARNGFDNFEDTYIEVSIEDQHVWHYVSGALCCESNCVTGLKGRHDTPVGVYYVSERINGKYLRGEDYKTWVNKWMRLTNGGVGLHDAYWRGRFGGNIYTYNGSHGCVNLPKQYAYKLYDEIYNGIPVVVY